MRRFLLFVVFSCIAVLTVQSLWPSQLDDYLALFSQKTSVNSGAVVTALGLVPLLLAALRMRLGRSERELSRLRRELDRLRRGQVPPEDPAPPPVPPVMAAYPSAPWEPSVRR
jgi:hypothetical protein